MLADFARLGEADADTRGLMNGLVSALIRCVLAHEYAHAICGHLECVSLCARTERDSFLGLDKNLIHIGLESAADELCGNLMGHYVANIAMASRSSGEGAAYCLGSAAYLLYALSDPTSYFVYKECVESEYLHPASRYHVMMHGVDCSLASRGVEGLSSQERKGMAFMNRCLAVESMMTNTRVHALPTTVNLAAKLALELDFELLRGLGVIATHLCGEVVGQISATSGRAAEEFLLALDESVDALSDRRDHSAVAKPLLDLILKTRNNMASAESE